MASRVYGAAWLGDSQLVVARRRTITDVAALSAALAPERARELQEKADALWRYFRAGIDDPAVNPLGNEAEAVVMYLCERYQRSAPETLADECADHTVELNGIALVRVDEDRFERGPTLYEGFGKIGEIRPTPDGGLIGFVVEADTLFGDTGPLKLFVVPTDGSTPAALVAEDTAAHFDWTPDGRSLLYLEGHELEGNASTERFGHLTVSEAVANDGAIRFVSRPLAQVAFETDGTARALRDGRVLFNARELHFPATPDDGREQLFIFDPSRQTAPLTSVIPRPALERLPVSFQSFAFVEVSPDSRLVLLGGADGDALLVTVAGGLVDRLESGLPFDTRHHLPIPMWRPTGGFTYLRKAEGRHELILRTDDGEVVLSKPWPTQILSELTK